MQSQNYTFLLPVILHQFHSIFLGAGTNKFMESSLQGCEQCSKFWRTVVSSSLGSHSPGEFVCCSYETVATTQPTEHSHIPEDLNSQQHHHENFRSSTEIRMTATYDSLKNGHLRTCVCSPFEHVQHPLRHNETSKYIDEWHESSCCSQHL